MRLDTVTLPQDGAAYRCCFTLDGWECDATTTSGLTVVSMSAVTIWLGQHPKSPVLLRGRAVCDKHVKLLAETIPDS